MIDLPKWIDPETWQAFEEMRKKQRRPMTDFARKLAVKKLLRLWELGSDPTEVLEQSIMCGYQGLWPVHSGRMDRRDEELRRELNAGTGPQVRRH